MTCKQPDCPAVIPPSIRFCPTCASDNGFPNVRQAEAEAAALEARLAAAEEDAKGRMCVDSLAKLRDLVKVSLAVIATNFNKAHALLRDDTEAYTNFYRLVSSGTRLPKPNWYDEVR